MSMSSVSRLFHLKRIIHNLLYRLNFLKIPQNSYLPPPPPPPPDRGKITIYENNFQQVNLTPNRGVSSPLFKYALNTCTGYGKSLKHAFTQNDFRFLSLSFENTPDTGSTSKPVQRLCRSKNRLLDKYSPSKAPLSTKNPFS